MAFERQAVLLFLATTSILPVPVSSAHSSVSKMSSTGVSRPHIHLRPQPCVYKTSPRAASMF